MVCEKEMTVFSLYRSAAPRLFYVGLSKHLNLYQTSTFLSLFVLKTSELFTDVRLLRRTSRKYHPHINSVTNKGP